MTQEITTKLNAKNNAIIAVLGLFALFCLSVYFFQVGILSQYSQKAKNIEAKNAIGAKERFAFSSNQDGANNYEDKILGLNFVKTEKINFIPVVDAYLAKAN